MGKSITRERVRSPESERNSMTITSMSTMKNCVLRGDVGLNTVRRRMSGGALRADHQAE